MDHWFDEEGSFLPENVKEPEAIAQILDWAFTRRLEQIAYFPEGTDEIYVSNDFKFVHIKEHTDHYAMSCLVDTTHEEFVIPIEVFVGPDADFYQWIRDDKEAKRIAAEDANKTKTAEELNVIVST